MGLKVRPMFIIKEIPNLFFSHPCPHMVNLALAVELPAGRCLCSCSQSARERCQCEIHRSHTCPVGALLTDAPGVRSCERHRHWREIPPPQLFAGMRASFGAKVSTRADAPPPSPAHEWTELVKTGTSRCFMQDSFPVGEMNEEVDGSPHGLLVASAWPFCCWLERQSCRQSGGGYVVQDDIGQQEM